MKQTSRTRFRTMLSIAVSACFAVAGCGHTTGIADRSTGGLHSPSGASTGTRVTGLTAGGLDIGSELSARYPLPRGKFAAIGLTIARNHGRSGARILRARAAGLSPGLEATGVRMWILPARFKQALPGAWPGWPPRGYPMVETLPTRNVLVPPGRDVQFEFGVRSSAPVGTTVEMRTMDVDFVQDGRRYSWTFPLPVRMKIVK